MKVIDIELVVSLLMGIVLGTLLRISCQHLIGHEFYLGNLLVYLAGSFFIGFIFKNDSLKLSTADKISMITGILGGLTAFSGFLVDFLNFAQVGEFKRAFLYFMITSLIAIAGCLLGYEISTEQDSMDR